jgi:hypothetical protein
MSMRKLVVAACVVTMIVTGVGLAIILLAQKDSTTATPPGTSLMTTAPRIPTPQEFRVGVKVTAQQCADPGVCTYTYSIQPMYVGNHPLPDQHFTVFYEVSGGSAVQTGDFTVSDGQTRVYKDVTVDGAPGAQLQATVTRVSAVVGPAVPGSSQPARPSGPS